jgi:hypothetical protein
MIVNTEETEGRKCAKKSKLGRLGLGAALFAGIVAFSAPGLAHAAFIEVTGSTEVADTGCSLRVAIENHNCGCRDGNRSPCAAGDGNDVIYFRTTTDFNDIFLNSPLPEISGGTLQIINNRFPTAPMTLHGAYFTVDRGASLKLTNINVRNDGALDYRTNRSFFANRGQLSIESGTFSNSGTSDGFPEVGGVLDNEGRAVVAISGSSFNNNSALGAGGAIFNKSGTVTMQGITLLGNQAPVSGGAIDNEVLGVVQISDSSNGQKNLIAENGSSQGGGIYNGGGTVNIRSSNFSISDNNAAAGGGIFSQGGVLQIARAAGPVQDIAIASNQTAGNGGGIFDDGSRASISGIEIKGNSTSNGGAGAGVYISNDSAKIIQTYFHDNKAAGFGGAIEIPDISRLNVTASTFANNTSAGGDAIDVQSSGQLTVLNSTLTDEINISDSNTARAQIVSSTIVGAQLSGLNGSPNAMTVRSSILQDVSCVNVSDSGFNLQFGKSNCPASIPTGDPALRPQGLEFNGGPTPTIRILLGSHAIDAVPLAACTDENGRRLKTDQRGFTRPAPRHRACDTGAFELGASQAITGQPFDRSGHEQDRSESDQGEK